MKKTSIEYDLSNDVEVLAFERALKSNDMAMVLWEILKNVRVNAEARAAVLSEKKNITSYDGIQFVYDEIYRLLHEYEIDIKNLIE